MLKITARAFASFTTLFAFPVFAQCPTPADMHQGALRFEGPNGEVETFRNLGDNLVESHYQSPGKPASRVVMANGIYVLSLQDRIGADDETRTDYSFDTDTSNMPRPFHKGAFRMEVEVIQGLERRTETQAYQFGEATMQMIGDCAYETILVTTVYDRAAEKEVYSYLPEFDVSFLSAIVDTNGTISNFPYVHVEATK